MLTTQGKSMNFQLLVKALIVDEDKFLIVFRSRKDERNPGEITIPGGFVKK